MKHLRENTGAVTLSRRLQLALIVLAVVTWFVGSLFPLVVSLRHSADTNPSYVWLLILSQVVMPILYLAIGLSYATRYYRGRLHQAFVGVFLAVLGTMMYNLISNVYNMYMVGFGQIREYVVEPSFIGQYGVELSIMVICLMLFTALIWHHDWRHAQ